jgi:hypothetical protein
VEQKRIVLILAFCADGERAKIADIEIDLEVLTGRGLELQILGYSESGRGLQLLILG